MAGGKLIQLTSGSKKPLYLKTSTRRKPRKKYNYQTIVSLKINQKPDLRVNQESSTDEFLGNDNTTEQKLSFNFTLGKMQNFSNYTAMFDRYRLDKIIINAIPRATNQVTTDSRETQGGILTIPQIAVCIDRDDSSTAGRS